LVGSWLLIVRSSQSNSLFAGRASSDPDLHSLSGRVASVTYPAWHSADGAPSAARCRLSTRWGKPWRWLETVGGALSKAHHEGASPCLPADLRERPNSLKLLVRERPRCHSHLHQETKIPRSGAQRGISARISADTTATPVSGTSVSCPVPRPLVVPSDRDGNAADHSWRSECDASDIARAACHVRICPRSRSSIDA
jgi:hypothetical protein